ncbi:MAG: ATP-binding protein [Prevotellaceae bacterium]|jgi:predicted AAA+ superfamily ATPase|nr:ATP-binding protein [Prevotellaceae bacterium]
MSIERALLHRLSVQVKPGKVLLLFGARRVGKTFLMRRLAEKFSKKTLFLNGEDSDTLALLHDRSIANYRRLLNGVQLLLIDEAQNIPDIGQKLKLMVDEIPHAAIVASGSSAFDLLNKTGEPLVGRSLPFCLHPFSQQELSTTENLLETKQNLPARLIYGAYPDVVLMSSDEQRAEYLRNIVSSYLLKDILAVDGIRSSSKMQDLLRLIAFQVGSEVSFDELGTQLGMSKNTVERYLDLLCKVFVVYRLRPYSQNLRKEITSKSKWYFYDNGVRNAIINNFAPLALRKDEGALWENYLIAERIKHMYNSGKYANLYFWRTYDAQEVDLIEEKNGVISAVEMKWGKKQPQAPVAFAKSYPQATYQVVNRSNYLNWINS